MKWFIGLLVPLFLTVMSGCGGDDSSSTPAAYVPKSAGTIVGIDLTSPDNTQEVDELNATLAALKCTVVNYDDPTAEIVVSTAGGAAYVQPGIPYLQISDHGSDVLTNSWDTLDRNTTVQITLLAAHPITANVASSWTSNGFWLYGLSSNDYIGWGTSATQTSLANITTTLTGGSPADHNGTLAVNDTNTSVYIGWNVYGSRATSNDIKVLDNSIAFLLGKL